MGENIRSNQGEKLMIDKLTKSFFEVFTNSNKQTPNWKILYEICIHEVLIIKKENLEQEVYNLENFIKPRKTILEDGTLQEFEEYEINEETRIRGNIAQRSVKYNKRGLLNGKYFEQCGNKFFQYIKTRNGWKISSVIWEDE